jgi:glycosyltransferase involved in cell wall biosynthesis
MALDLAVVMPVYNEEKHVASVIHSYEQVIGPMGISFLMIVLDDGSSDRTPEILDGFRNNGHIQVSHLPNAGHGPTILRGYRMAVTRARWVFQCDSDNDIDARHFGGFWAQRERHHAVIGIRTARKQSLSRRVISAGSRLTVRLLFGDRVTDVNCPFRLIGADMLAPIVAALHDGTFAPNIIISGMLAKSGARICEIPVPMNPETAPSPMAATLDFQAKSLRALRQTFAAALSSKRLVRELRRRIRCNAD